MDLECFKHAFPFGSCCANQQGMTNNAPPVTVDHIMVQAKRGSAECPGCGTKSDLREQMRHMSVFGRPEALFGLDSYTGVVTFASRSIPGIEILDIRRSVPYDGEIVYATVTQQGPTHNAAGDFLNSMPWVIAPQAAHQPWHMQLPFFVPAGEQQKVAVNVVVKPVASLPLARDLALQAVGSFHRNQFNIACIMLAASIEASLRPRIEEAYRERSVKVPNEMGYASLIERAQMLFEPVFGPQLIGHLKDLAKTGRNPAAHGNQASALSREDVGMWMVDAAVVYEWSRHAKLR